MGTIKNKTGIAAKTRRTVLDRDGRCCILCGSPFQLEIAHYISRAQLGIGVPQNLVLLCKKCHMAYDGTEREIYKPMIRDYLRSCYKNWNEKDLVYDKWSWTNED